MRWLVLACLTACSSEQFPTGFLWGTAVSGFQVDMGCPTLAPSVCEDHGSDWSVWATTPSLISDSSTHLSGQPLSMGPGHWELFRDDYRLLTDELASNAHRLSFEWSRVFPTSTVGVEGFAALTAVVNPDALAHYHQQLAELRGRGITPMVTLNHYTLPTCIHDAQGCHEDFASCTRRGWVDRLTTVAEIAKYAAFMGAEFGAEVDLWATLNEPMAIVLPGYLFPSPDRTNPPGLFLQYQSAKTAMQAMIEAHARMYDAVHANDLLDADGDGKAAEVGLVYSMVPVAPFNPDLRVDQIAAQNVFYIYNTAFLNAVILGEFDANLDRNTVQRPDLAGRMDYLGINYYTRLKVEGMTSPTFPELSPLTNFNPFTVSPWENYPRGIYEMALEAKRYGVPSFITENGTSELSGADQGVGYLVPHLTWLQRAISEGADVRGYFYWSLIDNYEWNHGMNMTFGLFSVDTTNVSKPRTARPTAAAYKRIVEAGRVPPDLRATYPVP